ncbi:MAG: flagellar motor switch protein FliN [Alphaproteobacteria bacterium]
MVEDQTENQGADTNQESVVKEQESKQKKATASKGTQDELSIEAVYDVPVQVSAVLGRVTMPVSHLLKLGRGAVVELDRRVGENVDVYVNNRLVARGEVVVMEDRLGITMTEILRSEKI